LICACIDIGSNTTRLLVADAGDGALRELVTQRAFTRIGKSMSGGGRIPQEKIAETAEVVRTQVAVANELGSEQIVAVATAAIRNAPNRDELVHAVEEAGGTELSVLTGEEEARLSFVGATRTLLRPVDGTVAVIDVGGGSSEIAIGEPDGRMEWSESFRIGSGFLADSYLRSDPPSVDELEKVRRHIAGTFEGLEPPPAQHAVAVGGTATSLRRLVGADTDRRGRAPLRARHRACTAAAGRHPRAGGDLGPAATPPAHRSRRPARGRAARARGGAPACLGAGDPLDLGRAHEHPQLAPIDRRQAALLEVDVAAGEVAHGVREVGLVSDQQDILARRGGQLEGIEATAGEPRLVLRLDPERLTGKRRSVGRTLLRARETGIELHAELLQRRPGETGLAAPLVGERTLRIRRAGLGIAMSQQPNHGEAP
jgi:exopolyphosphatase/guanosine-5'-triphosphate,3'-diphosphate pyrophosphatase